MNWQASQAKRERLGQNQISSAIPHTQPIGVFLNTQPNATSSTELIIQILVVHVSMFILALQSTETNLSHGKELL